MCLDALHIPLKDLNMCTTGDRTPSAPSPKSKGCYPMDAVSVIYTNFAGLRDIKEADLSAIVLLLDETPARGHM